MVTTEHTDSSKLTPKARYWYERGRRETLPGLANVKEILKDIDEKIQETGTPADDGSFASGNQKGVIEGLERAKLIVLRLKNQEEHIQFNRLKALSREEARANTELSREDKILGLMKYYGISRRKAIEELEDSGDH